MTFFESILTTFNRASLYKAAGAVVEISSSLQNLNHNQVKLAQISENHCMYLGVGEIDPHGLLFVCQREIGYRDRENIR